MAQPYIADIKIVGFNFPPRGWAKCDGQLMSIAQNTALFSILGTTFGGDGQTTFGLPDLRGRAPVHQGQGPGLSPRNLGESAGTENVTLTTPQMPAHSHPAMGDALGGGLPSPTNNTWGKKAARTPAALYQSNGPDTPMNAAALAPAGGSQPHNNLSPYLVLNFVIALEGVFPSQN